MAEYTYTAKQLAYFVQFIHPQKHFSFLPDAGDAAVAAMMGLDTAAYLGIKAGFAAAACRAAEELLAEPEFAAQVGRLPFAPGDTVVAIGDSITDDLQSWFEILGHVLRLTQPEHRITLVNTAISGDTTAALTSRFLDAVNLLPEWILCFVGTNDARAHGLAPLKTQVSAAETAANLAALRHFGATQTGARWLWITPGTVDEAAIAADWWLGGGQMMWRNADLHAIADVIRRQPDPVVDLQAVFGEPPGPAMLRADGLHPSLEGQKAILRAVVAKLAELGR